MSSRPCSCRAVPTVFPLLAPACLEAGVEAAPAEAARTSVLARVVVRAAADDGGGWCEEEAPAAGVASLLRCVTEGITTGVVDAAGALTPASLRVGVAEERRWDDGDTCSDKWDRCSRRNSCCCARSLFRALSSVSMGDVYW